MADSVAELAAKIVNPYQLEPLPASALEETVARCNSLVDLGSDPDFGRPEVKYKTATPPFTRPGPPLSCTTRSPGSRSTPGAV